MARPTDVRPTAAALFFLPVATRVPLKFGTETLTHVTCARVCVTVTDNEGNSADGWGETPLSVQWVWPSATSYDERHAALQAFCKTLTGEWLDQDAPGHPIEFGQAFIETNLPWLLKTFNETHRAQQEPMPLLAALVCTSAFDIATHDAFGQLHDVPIYQTYNSDYMTHDLSTMLEPAEDSDVSFETKYPDDFLASQRPDALLAWHLVGGLDPLDLSELQGDEPDDGYPITLTDWIKRDGLRCLKIKLRGNDALWDYDRLVKVGRIAIQHDVDWLTTDFNCTVTDPIYVNTILDRLRDEHPRTHGMILYVEQPFPYDLEQHRIDVHSVSARKPLFMDESAHDWELVKLGRSLGWTGVALKTCKTQTGAILSLCWAKAHGMTLMVQDLTNPMLAMIPHVLLAAHAGTIMGVETNAMQFYPDASREEEKVHPGLYKRRGGQLKLDTIDGPGFGYRVEEIGRELPEIVAK